MNEHTQPAAPKQSAVRRLVGVVGPRMLGYGGIVLLLVLFFGDLRSMLTPAPRMAPTPNVEQAGERTSETTADIGWPHLRGPHHTSTSDETDLADTWPSEGPPVLWTNELGRGYSGFVVMSDRAYTQTQSLYAISVICLDTESGAVVWRHVHELPYDATGLYPGPRSTPTLADGRVYFAGPRGTVGCLRAHDGTEVWSLNVIKQFDGDGFDFGYAASPLVENGLVVLPAGGVGASVVALDTEDGSAVWASGDQPASYCSAIPITFAGKRRVVVFLKNALALFDLKSGRLLWEEVFSQGYDEHSAMPLWDEPLLMTTSPFRSGSELYEIRVDDSKEVTAELIRYSPHMSNDVASSVLVDGFVYGFDLRDIQSKLHRPSRGDFKCVDFRSGEVRWSTEKVGHASVIVADGKLILFNDKGQVLLARVNPNEYEELARADVFGDEICWTPPALSNGRLYLRTPTRAACLYLGEPEALDDRQAAVARPASEIRKARRRDLSWMVGGGERTYVFDLPEADELRRWYIFSLATGLVPAAFVSWVAWLLLRRRYPQAARGASHVVFWAVAFLLGVIATPLANRSGIEFVFTWPLALFAMQQVAVMPMFTVGRGKSWVAAAAMLGLMATCLAYFHVCRVLSLVMMWVFLIGFVPSWPLAVPAARRASRPGRAVWDLVWNVAAFTAFFLAAAAFVAWRRM